MLVSISLKVLCSKIGVNGFVLYIVTYGIRIYLPSERTYKGRINLVRQNLELKCTYEIATRQLVSGFFWLKLSARAFFSHGSIPIDNFYYLSSKSYAVKFRKYNNFSIIFFH